MKRPRFCAMLVALGLASAALPQPAPAQAPGVAAARSSQADALARVRAERAAAERAMSAAATPQDAARAADRLRQATASQIAIETAGQDPQQMAQTVNRIRQEAVQRQAEIERTATEALARQLSGAASDAAREAVWRAHDASMASVRITQEVSGEAARRLNPVVTGNDFGPRRGSFNATQYRMDELLERITNTHVEAARLPSYTNPDGSRATDLDREIEEHRRRTQRDADVQEYLRLAEGGIFVDPATGGALSQELRDRIAKNAKLQLADVLRARGYESGVVRTLFGWTDSRDALGQQIEGAVRDNSWYQALDMLNPTVTGADPRMIALAMANVLSLSANQIEAWRAGQLPEGGEGGVTGWLYENFVAKQQTGLGTALRVEDLEAGGEIDRMLAAYRADVDAAVAALNEMARTPDPAELGEETHRLLESMGFISRTDGRESYRIPTGDTAQQLQRKLNLPGASMLDLIKATNIMKIVVMVALPQMAAARAATVAEGLELGAGAIGTGEFVASVLGNAALDAAFQKIETGTVQWDRVALDAAVTNLGLAAAGQITGGVAKATVTGTMSAEARAVAEALGRNPQAQQTAEAMLRQVLGLTADSALLTYWQSRVQGTGMSYDDFLANLLNGVVGRVAPAAGRAAKDAVATGIGRAPRTLRDAIFGMSPELREAFLNGLSPDGLARYIETNRIATQEEARRASLDRLRSVVGEDALTMEITDPRLVQQVTRALETGQLAFSDLKSVLGDNPSLNRLMDAVNETRLRTFNEIVDIAKVFAEGDILAEYDARVQRLREHLGDDHPDYQQAVRTATEWRDAEIAKLNDEVQAPGSKNNTSDIDRSITSTYLRNALKITIDEVFRLQTGSERVATSAAAYDVNEYFNIFRVIDRMQSHRFADGVTMSHADYMAALDLARQMLDMTPPQRQELRQNRARTGNRARDDQIWRKAEETLQRGEALRNDFGRLAREGQMDLTGATHRFADGTTMSHADYMAALDLATRMLDMNPQQRALALGNRVRTGDAARDAQIARKAEESLQQGERELADEVARLETEGYDPDNPDTVTRARDNLYGRRATGLAQKEATLARLDPNSEYARDLAAEIQAEWAVAKREGIEAYTNITGLDIVVKKGQMRGVTMRELITGQVDQDALDSSNAGRRREGRPERTATQQQELIDQSLREIRTEYRPEDMQGAIDDQIRFITHHLNGYFQGHESATQAAAALSKYIERVMVFSSLAGRTVTGGQVGELNALAGELVRNRGNLQNLTRLITQMGNGDADAGMRRIATLVEQGIPGLQGLFDPTLVNGLAAGGGGARTPTGPGAGSLSVFLRQRELERAAEARRSGSASVAQSARQEKLQQEAELARLQREKAEDERLATQYDRSDWRLARDLEAQVASLAVQLNALPLTKTATATYTGLANSLRDAQARLDALKKRRTSTGARPTEADQWRDRRIASLQAQIAHTDRAIARYTDRAAREAADARNRIETGSSTFNPINDAQRVTTGPPSSTPELDKFGAELAKIWDEPPPLYTLPPPSPVVEPPPPPTATGGPNPFLTGGLSNGGATITVRADGSVAVRVGTTTYPGLVRDGGGFTIWAPDTPIDLNAPPPNPIAITEPSPLPTGGLTRNPDGSTTYPGVPITGLPGSGGSDGTTSPLPGAIRFTPTAPGSTGRARTGGGAGAGGGAGGESSTIGAIGGYPGEHYLGEHPGMGFAESESFVPNPDGPMTSGPVMETFVGEGNAEIDLGGGTLAGDPGTCCTPGVQVMTLDFGDPATVAPFAAPAGPGQAARRGVVPRALRGLGRALASLVRAPQPVAASRALAFANQPIGLPPAFGASEPSRLPTGEGEQVPTMPNSLQTFLVANGNSQGEAFDVQIVNTGPNPITVFGSGVVVEPIKRELQAQARQQMARLIGSGANVLARKVDAYCLQYALSPPSPGMLFQIASPALQRQFKPAGMIMSAARQLAAAGALSPDSNPRSYLDSIKQYAIWTKFEGWDVKKFGEVLLEKTKAAAAAAKANWTGQMTSALMSAVPNRWRDIQTVLSAAQELAARPQP
ncbi:MAG: hypothetical protein IT176_04450 [Acidobacteria bacterium]|nr:hypothetical protein [Acidobacteriota bacterium]